MQKSFGFLKTTAVGGLIFLLPLIVVGALLGQVAPVVYSIATTLGAFLPVKTPQGIGLLFLLAITVVLLLCFAAGLLARRTWGKRLAQAFEKNLLLLFPRYVILKDQMAGTIGGEANVPRMKPVLATFDDSLHVGMEIERGSSDLVTVFLPGSPDPWSGRVVLLQANRVEPLAAEFGDAVATFEQLGRGSLALLASKSFDSTGK